MTDEQAMKRIYNYYLSHLDECNKYRRMVEEDISSLYKRLNEKEYENKLARISRIILSVNKNEKTFCIYLLRQRKKQESFPITFGTRINS